MKKHTRWSVRQTDNSRPVCCLLSVVIVLISILVGTDGECPCPMSMSHHDPYPSMSSNIVIACALGKEWCAPPAPSTRLGTLPHCRPGVRLRCWCSCSCPCSCPSLCFCLCSCLCVQGTQPTVSAVRVRQAQEEGIPVCQVLTSGGMEGGGGRRSKQSQGPNLRQAAPARSGSRRETTGLF